MTISTSDHDPDDTDGTDPKEELVKLVSTPNVLVYHHPDCRVVTDPALIVPRAALERRDHRYRPGKCCYPEEYE